MRRRDMTWQSLCLLFLVATSCTAVKEDRLDCPCSLFISLEALPEEPVDILVYAADELCFRDEVDRDTTLLVRVPKRQAVVVGVSGAVPEQDGSVRIPSGGDCPPVFLSAQRVETAQDTARCRVRLRKHFCTLSLRFDGPPGWGEPYSVRIRGGVAGLLADGTPQAGEFSCTLQPGGSCRLPRQRPDGELWLDIAVPEGVLRSFALGTYLAAAGYDWTAPDLKDSSLRIDLSVTAVRFTIGLWTATVPLEIVV